MRVSRFSNTRTAADAMAVIRPVYPHFPCCFVGWDNTARRGRQAMVMRDSTPELFGKQLSLVANGVLHKPPEERVVFINAWNEWAEGMYLEPDRKFGHGYLQAVASVLQDLPGVSHSPNTTALPEWIAA